MRQTSQKWGLRETGWFTWANVIAIILSIWGFVCVHVVVAALTAWLSDGSGLPILFVLDLIYVWLFVSFFYYRFGRQQELLHLLTTAVEANAPLAPALRAYLADRPRGPTRELWIGIFLFCVLPGYYWLWYRRHRYDRKIAFAAGMLEAGYPLDVALRSIPGLVPRQVQLAATLGQSTGRLDTCLRQVVPTRVAPVWLEVLPRVAYPLFVLFFIDGVFEFWNIYVLPKMETIFHDFDAQPPELTTHIMTIGRWVSVVGLPLVTLFLAVACVAATALLVMSSTLRWYCPVVGSIFRRSTQSRVLNALGAMLGVGKTVPESLAVLADSGSFAWTVEDRLTAARERIERGEPMAATLYGAGLLPRFALPLVQAAERMHNLPFVLRELSEVLANRLTRRIRRISIIVAPLILIAVGSLVGTLALGMFLPLIDLMARCIP